MSPSPSTEDKCKYRQELTSTGDVITTVGQNPNAIGYASLAAVKDTVKALTVGGVAPTEETVKDGSYVIQRPFVLVTKDGVSAHPPPRRRSSTTPLPTRPPSIIADGRRCAPPTANENALTRHNRPRTDVLAA